MNAHTTTTPVPFQVNRGATLGGNPTPLWDLYYFNTLADAERYRDEIRPDGWIAETTQGRIWRVTSPAPR